MSRVFNMAASIGAKLTGITITTPPTKTTYLAGDTFDPAGMVVMAAYSDGTTAQATGFIISPSAPLEDGMTYVSVIYTERGETKTATQTITVTHRLVSIDITTQPTKREYELYESFDPTGMVITATYSDGTTAAVSGYTWRPTTFTSLRSEVLVITYEENGVAAQALKIVSVRRITIATEPSQSGTLTYNGSAQSPTWSNYDAEQLDIGGVTFGTNAGTYEATFRPTLKYRWADGSTDPKPKQWSIGKADGSLSLSESSVTLNSTTKSTTVTVTRAGDGEISAVSNNTSVATVSVSGNVLTINSVNDTSGEATITVSVAEGTNHLAPSSKTVAVDAQFLPAKKSLNETSWEDISTVSAAGQAANYWAVGDHKGVAINGTIGTLSVNSTQYVYILGFAHHGATNTVDFGTFKTLRAGGGDICLCDSKYGSNSSDGSKYFNLNHWGGSSSPYNTNYGGWKGCDARYDVLGSTNRAPSGYGSTPRTSRVGYDATATTATSPVANTLMAALPSDLRAVMKPMTIYTDNKGNSSNVAANVTTSVDYLPLLSEFEIFGSRTSANQYERNQQEQYQYYKNGNSKVKYEHNDTSTAAYWWERSPGNYGNSAFCYVTTGGGASGSGSRGSRGLAPAFRV